MYRIMGQSNLEFPIDRAKCASWNISVADVEEVIQTAVGGKPFTRMIEGEKAFDITLRWPERLRSSEEAILDIPVDVTGHKVTEGPRRRAAGRRRSPAPSTGHLADRAPACRCPRSTGSRISGASSTSARRPGGGSRELVSPMGRRRRPSRTSGFVRPGATTIFREQGSRVIAVKFSVRGRDLAGAVAEAQAKVAPLIKAPYRTEWSGEFRQMEQAERRMVLIIALALALIFVLLYLAFGSLLDALVIFANVAAMSLGGIWALC